jgi:phosphoribosylaminoimidazolecarboxamide formyltransferase/IMP cyclohydrolase
VFAHTAQYDGAITNYLTSLTDELQHSSRNTTRPRSIWRSTKVQDLRYGENPHQSAAFYRDLSVPAGALANYEQLQGKELSYNNIADSDAAWECVKTFDVPACVIVKHANPCGVADRRGCERSVCKGVQTDPTSAFGGIIAFNREVDEATAQAVAKQFVEVLIAPSFSEARGRCSKRSRTCVCSKSPSATVTTRST